LWLGHTDKEYFWKKEWMIRGLRRKAELVREREDTLPIFFFLDLLLFSCQYYTELCIHWNCLNMCHSTASCIRQLCCIAPSCTALTVAASTDFAELALSSCRAVLSLYCVQRKGEGATHKIKQRKRERSSYLQGKEQSVWLRVSKVQICNLRSSHEAIQYF